MIKFTRYDGKKLQWDTFNMYTELGEELGTTRSIAKQLFYSYIYDATDLRLGALAQGVDMDKISAEDSRAYSLTGEFVREIIEHYIIEKYRCEVFSKQQLTTEAA